VVDVQLRLAYDRTNLANERTFAAWVRTGLAIGAVGIAVGHLLPATLPAPVVTLTLGTVFVLLGIAVIAFGAWRFVSVSRDLEKVGSRHALVHPGLVVALTVLLGGAMLAVLMIV
jgi:putative membrane protein